MVLKLWNFSWWTAVKQKLWATHHSRSGEKQQLPIFFKVVHKLFSVCSFETWGCIETDSLLATHNFATVHISLKWIERYRSQTTELLACPKTQLPVLSGFSSRELTERKNEKKTRTYQRKKGDGERGRGQEGANRLVYMLKQTHQLTGQDNTFTPHVEGAEIER